MASEKDDGGGGFGWGFFVGGLIGFVAGAYLASGPGKEHVDSIRSRTIELTNSTELGDRARAYAERARSAVQDPEHPLGKAVREGVAAARRRRSELDSTPTGVDITENGKSE
jgi:gas vesicle protein